jgi:hypothetical protein
MKDVHLVVGVLAIALNAVAAAWGGWQWYQIRRSVFFWRLLRAGQAIVVVEVALGGLLLVLGHKSPSLHTIYGLLPLGVSLFAEQFRVLSAQMVLQQRGFQSSAEVARLPEREQRVVVLTIIRREMGVMALGALIVVVLLARAAMTAG